MKKLLKSKKATEAGRKTIFYIIFGITAAVFFLVLSMILTSWTSDVSKMSPEIEKYLIIQRFLTSNICFTYQDEDTGRIYPYIIDWEKFSDETLNNCYSSPDKYAFRITLENLNKNSKKTAQTAMFTGTIKQIMSENVKIFYESQFDNGKLSMEIEEIKDEKTK